MNTVAYHCFHHTQTKSNIMYLNMLYYFCILSTLAAVYDHDFGVIRHDKDREQYRLLGAQPQFDCVARYSTIAQPGDYACGVLVAPDWILTAAHFLEDSSMWNIKDHTYYTRRIIKHPNLTPGATETQWSGWDMALVQLDRSVVDVSPASRYAGRGEVGVTITKIGYGYAGTGVDGLTMPRVGERMGGNNIVDSAGGSVNGRHFTNDVLVADFDSPLTDTVNRFGSSIPLELEVGGSKGDSGGGVFMVNNGKWELVGIVSGGLSREIKYGAMMAFARVSSASAWIDSVIHK